MSVIRHPKFFDPTKVYMRSSLDGVNINIASTREIWFIGYRGMGEAPIPESVIDELAALPYTYKPTQVDILKMCIVHSQIIDFEDVN